MKEKIKNNCVWNKSFHLSPFTFHSKKAFTLSELMVVMVVLGVLAAIAIPAVMKVKPSQNRVMFKKAYFTLEKMTSDLSNDDTAYPEDQVSPTGCAVGLMPSGTTCGFAYNAITTAMGVPAGQRKFCSLLAQSVNGVPNSLGHSYECTGTETAPAKVFTTPDGIEWYYDADSLFAADAVGFNYIGVDVNGGGRPNCAETTDYFASSSTSGSLAKCPSPDRFAIGIRYDGNLKVVGTVAQDILLNPTVNNKPDGKAY